MKKKSFIIKAAIQALAITSIILLFLCFLPEVGIFRKKTSLVDEYMARYGATTVVPFYKSKNIVVKIYDMKRFFVAVMVNPHRKKELEIVKIYNNGFISKVYKLKGQFNTLLESGGFFYIATSSGLWRFNKGFSNIKLLLRDSKRGVPEFNDTSELIKGNIENVFQLGNDVFYFKKELGSIIGTPKRKVKMWEQKLCYLSDDGKEAEVYSFYTEKLPEITFQNNYIIIKTSKDLFLLRDKDKKVQKIECEIPIRAVSQIDDIIVFYPKWECFQGISEKEKEKKFDKVGKYLRNGLKIRGRIWVLVYDTREINDWGESKKLFGRVLSHLSTEKTIQKGKEYESINTLWLGTTDGLWKMVEGNYEKVSKINSCVFQIKKFMNYLWVATEYGIWRLDSDGKIRETMDVEFEQGRIRNRFSRYPVKCMTAKHGYLWISSKGLTRRLSSKDNWRNKYIVPGNLIDVVQFNHALWVLTDKGLFQVGEDDKIRKIEIPEDLDMIKQVNNELWVQRYPGWNPVKSYITFPGGLWKIDSRENTDKILNLNITDLIELDDGSYITGSAAGGLCRIYPIGPKINSYSKNSIFRKIEEKIPGLWIEGNHRLSVNLIVVERAVYKKDCKILKFDLSKTAVGTRRIVTGNKKAVAAGSADTPLKVTGWGKRKIEYDLYDDYGNHFKSELKGFVLPSTVVVAPFFFFTWIVFWTWVFYSSNSSSIAHRFFMHPYLRKIGYLGMLPMLMKFEILPVDRVLKKYLKNLKASFGNVRNREKETELRNEGEKLLQKKLKQKGIVYIESEKPVDSSLFNSIARLILDSFYEWGFLFNLIPVVIDGKNLKSGKLEDEIFMEFRKLGEITDKQFVYSLLRNGGFVILINNFDAISQDKVGCIMEEIDIVSKDNLVMIFK